MLSSRKMFCSSGASTSTCAAKSRQPALGRHHRQSTPPARGGESGSAAEDGERVLSAH